MSEFAEKKSLKAQIAAAKKAGKSMQTVGKLQYKLNQLMKTKQKGKPVKRKTPLTGSPSAGTGTAKKVVKKKAGGKMSDLVYDKPKGKGTGIVKSTAKTTPYKPAKIKDLSANKRAELVRKQGSPSGRAASLKLRELKDTMKRMKASGSSAAALSTIKAKIAKLQA